MRSPIRLVICLGIFCCAVIRPVLGESASQSAWDEQIHKADALQEKGSLAEARKIYESVLTGLRAGQSSSQLGYVLNALSQLASAQGNYDEAIRLAQQAADVYQGLGDEKGEAHALNYRGIAEVQRGLYAAAHESLTRALALSRHTGDLQHQTRILNNLGTADFYPGNYLQALRAYEAALQIIEQNPTSPWSGYWRQITQINQATIYQRLGRYQHALQIYQDVERSAQGLTASDRAHLLTNLGALYRRLGDPWKALEQYQSALRLYGQQHDADGEISTLKNIGIVYALDQADLGKAQQYFERGLRRAMQTGNAREEMQAHLYLGETLLRKGAVLPGRQQFQTALEQARRLGTAEEEWKALYGLGRMEERSGQVADAEAKYRAAVSIIEKSRSQLQLSSLRAEFLADKRDVFDALIALLLSRGDISSAFLYLEKSRARTFQDRLAGTSAAATDSSLEEVRRYLDDSTVLLEFWTSGDKLALIWCTRNEYGVVQNRISANDFASLRSFLRALPDNLQGDWRRQTQVLGRLLPQGLPLSERIRRAYIVPDGWLSSLPFDLVPAGPSGQLLIERLEITYLPTAALLRRPAPGNGVRFPWKRQLVAFGDPMVSSGKIAQPELTREPTMDALPRSAEESRSVAGLTSGRSELFLGAADTRDAFFTRTGSAPILHVSTHAFADADNPENSRILFSPETPGGESDYVFLREMYGLDLNGIELATLSACDTERGAMVRGEGIQAFSRALLSAGSRSAVTTLWKVDDQATAEFMKQFYYYSLAGHQPAAEALRAAKLKLLASGTALGNPADWAAFVVNGDGFRPLPVFISWAQVVAGSALLLALASAALVLRRRRWLLRVHRS